MQKVMAHRISRPGGIPDSLIISWIDDPQMIKGALSDLDFHSLLDCQSRFSDRPPHQKVKTYVSGSKCKIMRKDAR
jgi:hypothetical protein